MPYQGIALPTELHHHGRRRGTTYLFYFNPQTCLPYAAHLRFRPLFSTNNRFRDVRWTEAPMVAVASSPVLPIARRPSVKPMPKRAKLRGRMWPPASRDSCQVLSRHFWQAFLPRCFKPGTTRHQVLNTLDYPLLSVNILCGCYFCTGLYLRLDFDIPCANQFCIGVPSC